MATVTKEQYEFALQRVEELLPLVDENTPANDRNALELTIMSNAIIEYESVKSNSSNFFLNMKMSISQ